MLNSSTKKNNSTSYILIAILFIIVALTISIPLLNLNFDFRRQASVGSLDSDVTGNVGRIVKDDRELFSSKENKYFINYDKNTWQQNETPDTASKNDQDASYFVTKDKTLFTTIYISKSDLDGKMAEIMTKEVTRENLELLANELEKQFELKSPSEYIKISYKGREIVEINGHLAIKFEFTESFLGNESSYFEYVIPHNDYYVEVEVRASNKLVYENIIPNFLNSIAFTPNYSKVMGVSDNNVDSESKTIALVKPSVVNIIHTFCDEIKGGNTAQFLKSYKICNGGQGSGFFIGKNNIGTNGHVVVSHPEEAIMASLAMGNPQIFPFLIDFVKEVLYRDENVRLADNEAKLITGLLLSSPNGFNALLQDLYKSMESKEFLIERIQDNHFVNLGNKPIEIKKDQAITADNINSFITTNDSVVAADLVGYDYANFFSKKIFMDGEKPKESDVAILKLEDNNKLSLPSLRLNEMSVREGDNVFVIGFPGIVSGDNESSFLLNYEQSSTQATVSKGIISSIKKDHGGKELFQIDASIDHGNSGGPAINNKSEVVGLATYGIESKVGTFNFLRDVKDLRALAEANNVDVKSSSRAYDNWQKGLEFFWASRYTKAISYFNRVKNDYPMHPDADSYIADAERAIEEGKDIDLIFGIQKTYLVLGVISLLVITLLGIGYKKFGMSGLKSMAQANMPSMPAQPPVK